mmetsp:Transcript_11781/g.28828  ORF Transcript_11781/g.28828 Transcript_11781/m.28828 type:complete len:340 (+) Transcript_11781:31-1050(+)
MYCVTAVTEKNRQKTPQKKSQKHGFRGSTMPRSRRAPPPHTHTHDLAALRALGVGVVGPAVLLGLLARVLVADLVEVLRELCDERAHSLARAPDLVGVVCGAQVVKVPVLHHLVHPRLEFLGCFLGGEQAWALDGGMKEELPILHPKEPQDHAWVVDDRNAVVIKDRLGCRVIHKHVTEVVACWRLGINILTPRRDAHLQVRLEELGVLHRLPRPRDVGEHFQVPGGAEIFGPRVGSVEVLEIEGVEGVCADDGLELGAVLGQLIDLGLQLRVELHRIQGDEVPIGEAHKRHVRPNVEHPHEDLEARPHMVEARGDLLNLLERWRRHASTGSTRRPTYP